MPGTGTLSRQRSHAIAFEPIYALPRAAIGLGYLGCYILLDLVSFVHPYTPFGITPWNPATGLSLSMILLFGRQMIPFLFPAQRTANNASTSSSPSPRHRHRRLLQQNRHYSDVPRRPRHVRYRGKIGSDLLVVRLTAQKDLDDC